MRQTLTACCVLGCAVLFTCAATRGADQSAPVRYLIIHGDDAGMSHSANIGTIDAMEQGVVSSASIMVPCPWFVEIAEYARAHPERDFGVHLTLNCEWKRYRWGTVASRDKVPSLLDPDGYMWSNVNQVREHAKTAEVEIELRAQIERAKQFQIPITHLDTHMGAVLARPDLVEVYVKLGLEYDLPILFLNAVDEELAKEYPALAERANALLDGLRARNLPLLDQLAQIYGDDRNLSRRDAYLETLRNLKPGVSQLIVHCGYDDAELRAITSSAPRRDEDRRVFSDPAVKELLEQQRIQVVGWKQLRDMRQAKVEFKKHHVGKYRGEVCDVADFNNDKVLDIVAGDFIYLGPEFKPVKIRAIQTDINAEGKGYDWDFMNAPLDVDGDGLLDVVSCSWFGMQVEWYRNNWDLKNNKIGGELWTAELVHKNSNYECGELMDLDGDGQRAEIITATKATEWYEVGTGPDGKRGLMRYVVDADENKHTFGIGVGDVNGDGRPDILRPSGWYEAPEDIRTGTWKEHPLAVGSREDGKADHTPQILVYDVNADGLNDIVTSIAHDYGIFWYEQGKGDPDPTWKRHVIDDTWSQAHSFELADIDADGDLDLVTGKRFMAHNGGDPGAFEPVGVYWYELDRGAAPRWTKHAISYDEGIGSGLVLRVVDLDQDGDLDVVVTGKWGGPAWFENQLK